MEKNMQKNFKTVMLSTIVAFTLIGCGNSSDGDAIVKEVTDPVVKEDLPKVSKELKSLVKSTRDTTKDIENNLDKLPSQMITETGPQAYESKNCSNGGTMDFTTDFNQTVIANNPTDYNITMTSEAIDCVESGMTVNGKIETKVRVLNQKEIMTLTYLTDFNITDGAKIYTIKQGSTMVSEEVDENRTKDIENLEIVSDQESYKSVDLKSIEEELTDKTSTYYISGKEIVDGKTFIVDESYDSNSTPLVYDEDDNLLKGGKTLYTNDQNHSIVIEAIDKNKIKISVDEDRDGKVDKEEVVSL